VIPVNTDLRLLADIAEVLKKHRMGWRVSFDSDHKGGEVIVTRGDLLLTISTAHIQQDDEPSL
jgi:hypothetical protein